MYPEAIERWREIAKSRDAAGLEEFVRRWAASTAERAGFLPGH